MSDDKVEGVELSRVVDQLRNELFELTRTVDGQDLRFLVESVELELKVVVTKSGGVDAKAKFWVLEVGAEGKYEHERTQTVKLTLKPRLATARGNGEVTISRE